MVDKLHSTDKHRPAKHRFKSLSLAVALLTLLAACASTEPPQHALSKTHVAPAAIDTPPVRRDYPVRPFRTQTFYDLLVAEFAGTRGNLSLALENYRRQARITRDPGVIARAVSTASYQKNNAALQELGPLWAEIEPKSIQAHNMAFYAEAQKANLDIAFEHALYLLSRDNGKYLVLLPSYTARLDSQKRLNLLNHYEAGEQHYPHNRNLLLGKILLLAQLARIDEAISTANDVLSREPDDQPVRLVVAQILHKAGRHEASINELAKGLKYAPKSQQLQLQLIRFMAESNLPLAIKKMSSLAEQETDNDKFKLALALLHRENNSPLQARKIYQALITKNRMVSQAHFQLATMDQKDQLLDNAIQHYRMVSDNKLFLPATVRLTTLLANQNQLNDARLYLHKLRLDYPAQARNFYQIEGQLLIQQQHYKSAQSLLDEGLAEHPGDIDLLYSRSLNNEKLGNLAATEEDLRTIIQSDSNNASALNALGYTLANRTERYDEALKLIQRALAIKPNDPAIRDSLGWVHFKRGEYDAALGHLRAAMNTMPDPEVAAHLIEVLWATGEEEEARSIWKDAIDVNPSSKSLLDTLQRLDIQP